MMTSGRGWERVSDGKPGQLSPFANALLDALSGEGEALTATRLKGFIQNRFLQMQFAQEPQLIRPVGAAGEGEFVFFLKDPESTGGSP